MTLLCHKLNQDIGMEAEHEHLVAQAVDVITRFGVSVKEAAEKYFISEAMIREVLQANVIRQKAQDLGIPLPNASTFTLHKLHKLREDEPVLRKVLVAVRDHNIAGVRLDDLVKLAKTQKTEATRLAAIDQYVVSVYGTYVKKPRGTKEPKQRIKSLVGQLINLIGDKKATQLGFTSPSEDQYTLSSFLKLGERLVKLGKEKIGEC